MQEQVAGKPTAQDLLAQVGALVGNDLVEMERVYAAELNSPQGYIREVLSHLMNYRGKRLRPVLLLLAGKACGELTPAHSVLAAVVEMIHTATLVHDDVLDDATTRRHVATVNSRWTNETSVLLGDYLFTHAFHLTSSLGSAFLCRCIGRATNRVCEGEMWQVAERGNLQLAEEQYLEIIEAKTAELCAVSCALGAHAAGAPQAVIDQLDAYGRSLGIAFQIADDLLDLLGSESVTGKSLGSDVRQQKLTLPVIYLLSRTWGAEAAKVRDVLRNPDENSAASLLPFLVESQAFDYARQRAREFVDRARRSLAVLPDSPAKSLLEDLAEFVTSRTH